MRWFTKRFKGKKGKQIYEFILNGDVFLYCHIQ